MSTLNATSVPRPPADWGLNGVSDFDLRQNGCGRWVITGTDNHWGGIFLTRDAALKFARAELEEAACEPWSRRAERAA
jgi:hypothetical protein